MAAHDDSAARRQGCPVQDARQLEGFGVGPHGVVIGAQHGERAIRQDLVEVMSRRVRAGTQHVVPGAVRINELVVGAGQGELPYGSSKSIETVYTREVEVLELSGAHENMHMAFNKPRHHRLAARIDLPRVLRLEKIDLLASGN